MKNKDGIEHTPFTVLTENEIGIIAVDDQTKQPLLNLNADDVAGYAMEFLGNILGDDLGMLVRDCNANIEVIRKQHETIDKAQKIINDYVARINKLTVEVENSRATRKVQSKAIDTATFQVLDLQKENKKLENDKKQLLLTYQKYEEEVKSLKKRLDDQKQKNKELQGKLNVAAEKQNNLEFKFNSLKKGVTRIADYSQVVIQACKEAEKIMLATGRYVEATIPTTTGGEFKFAKVPLNIKSHNNLNIKLAAMGYPVSLKHNYCYTIEDGLSGQQYVFAGEEAGDLVCCKRADLTKDEAVRKYLIEQFKNDTANFDNVDSDTDFSIIAKRWNELVSNIYNDVVDVGSKFLTQKEIERIKNK